MTQNLLFLKYVIFLIYFVHKKNLIFNKVKVINIVVR